MASQRPTGRLGGVSCFMNINSCISVSADFSIYEEGNMSSSLFTGILFSFSVLCVVCLVLNNMFSVGATSLQSYYLCFLLISLAPLSTGQASKALSVSEDSEPVYI